MNPINVEIGGEFFGQIKGKAFVFDWYENEDPKASRIPVNVEALRKCKRHGVKFLLAKSTVNNQIYTATIEHAERVGKVVDGWMRVHVNEWDYNDNDARDRRDRTERLEREDLE